MIAHLLVLRAALIRSLLTVLVCFIPMAIFSAELYAWFIGPLEAYLPAGASFVITSVLSAFWVPMKLSCVLSLFLAMPVILYELWRFISPGLYQYEQQFTLGLLLSSAALFYTGVLTGYYLIFPALFYCLIEMNPVSVVAMLDIHGLLSLNLWISGLFGFVFEIPILILICIRSGITTGAGLAKKRPYIIVSCFIISMFITPPDVISQILLAVPMWCLFELGLLIAYCLQRETHQSIKCSDKNTPEQRSIPES